MELFRIFLETFIKENNYAWIDFIGGLRLDVKVGKELFKLKVLVG